MTTDVTHNVSVNNVYTTLLILETISIFRIMFSDMCSVGSDKIVGLSRSHGFLVHSPVASFALDGNLVKSCSSWVVFCLYM